MRGNHPARLYNRREWRSIPACAGEPEAAWALGMDLWVYPRVCGGTLRGGPHTLRPPGLSPRVRGNPLARYDITNLPISIPACAGEPLPSRYHLNLKDLYPRVCGGTKITWGTKMLYQGLSPRVRGNHVGFDVELKVNRSIPACAGEPVVG